LTAIRQEPRICVPMPFRLLVVDDEPSVRRYFSDLLCGAGYDIVTAADIPSAMHVMAEGTADLLITDVRLDGYNGLHLLAMAPNPIPAIVVTGFPDAAVEAEARQLGADYLLKPIDPTQLLAAVARRLARLGSSR
jgi:DNA-binding NtrC family response regulator